MTPRLQLRRPIAAVILAFMVGTAAPARGQTLQWVRQFGTPLYDSAPAVTTDAAGNIYVGGVTGGTLPSQTSAGNGDAFLARYDAAGNVVWLRQFGTAGEDGISAAATDSAGAVYAAGFSGGATSIGGTAGLLVKYDSAGNRLWIRQFGTPDFSTAAVDVDTDAAGNVYVLGWRGNLSGTESFIVKYSAAGDLLWTQTLSSEFDALRLATDTAGHVYVVGRSGLDAFIAQYDGMGNETWLRHFGTASTDIAQGVATNALGDVYVVGLQDGYDLEAAFLAQYDAAGNQNWLRSFTAETFAPWAMTVAADAEGNALIAGFVFGTFAGETTAGHFDVFVLQYDRAGTQGWVRQLGTSERDDARGIAVDLTGNIYVSGNTLGTFAGQTAFGGSDAFLARFVVDQVSISERIAAARSALAEMVLPDGMRRSLASKLAAAQRSADAGQISAMCGQLTAFANEVAAQEGKELTSSDAALLRNSISAALAEAGCGGALDAAVR